jgi:hypothetical protein
MIDMLYVSVICMNSVSSPFDRQCYVLHHLPFSNIQDRDMNSNPDPNFRKSDIRSPLQDPRQQLTQCNYAPQTPDDWLQ